MGFPDALLAADRLVTQQLGETVRCSLWGVDPWSNVVGVFAVQYVTASASDTGVISTAPALFARVSDLPTDPDSGDEIQVHVPPSTPLVGTSTRAASPAATSVVESKAGLVSVTFLFPGARVTPLGTTPLMAE